jgi:hypothetical protein
MNYIEALTIVSQLSDGKNPFTAEVIPSDSLLQNGDVIRALFLARSALERMNGRESRRGNQPANAGKPWTSEEDSRLVEQFDGGISLKLLASEHGRSVAAVQARLVRLGKIDEASVQGVF